MLRPGATQLAAFKIMSPPYFQPWKESVITTTAKIALVLASQVDTLNIGPLATAGNRELCPQ